MEDSADAIDQIAARESWTAEDHKQLMERLFSERDATRKLRMLLADLEEQNPDPSGAAALKIGIGRYMLCRFSDALDVLVKGTDNKDRRYFQGLCHKYLHQYPRAAEEFQRAKDRGWDQVDIDLQMVEVRALGGELEAAGKALAKLESKAADNPQFYYCRGLIDELRGFGERAAESYVHARSLNPEHAGATFRLAYYYDLHGEQEEAVELYRRCTSRPPVHVSALLNLAVLYEDVGHYDAAALCLRRILQCNPTHARARLFLKDVESSKTMYYDEDQARRIARRNAVLDIPVTDFELSVRARNCLKKMNIRNLGDLVRTTETELLAYKNFGETSLKEIKDMMTAKGLALGQGLEEVGEFGEIEPAEQTNVGDHGVLATPVEQIEFSVRSRRALDSLNVRTLGELAGKTEAELLACRNFGQTSLNEIRQRLAEYGLQLREPN